MKAIALTLLLTPFMMILIYRIFLHVPAKAPVPTDERKSK
ncbi:hypothetical protein SAMN05444279_12175 [Ruegeria intermedia]|uniref:Uncharacterized protein n=1 Tax=Ruegeria intermedia TaxID=996115 RepID=A0A1M4ZTV3_9RHOB|nr:hypothetical protein SAMN05444279_12175 [Ruegeria intermedia]